MHPTRQILALTGARGWVGGCLAHHFQQHEWYVRGLVRQPMASASEIGGEERFSLGTDISPTALPGAAALIHCAYDFAPRTWPEIERINVRGTERLFAAARDAGIARLVLISTMSAFAGCKSLYGRAKLEMERVAAAHGALILRPGLVYGEHAGGMYGSLEAQVRNSRLIPLIGGGDQVLYLVHNEDLSDLARRFCIGEFSAPTMPITVAHEQPWTFRKILVELAARAGRKPLFLPVPWRGVWLALKAAELSGLRLGFRSDSLVSLVNQNPAPDFSEGVSIGFQPRPYATLHSAGATP